MSHNLFNTLQEFKMESGKAGKFYSLPALEKSFVGKISRLAGFDPYCAGVSTSAIMMARKSLKSM